MTSTEQTDDLENMLERIHDAACEEDQISLGLVMEHVGRRSFGPLLLLSSIIVSAPIIGDIPGVPTLVALLVGLISIQLLFGHKYFWLPDTLLNRSLSQQKLRKSIGAMRKPARFIDRLLKPRLSQLTEGAAVKVIAAVALLISLAMPPMEVIPFSANLAGLALTAYGLALMAKDGLVAIIAYLCTAGIVVLGIQQVL